MSNLVNNIEELVTNNNFFRHVILTSKHQQLVVMHLNTKDDIGLEVHDTVDQFIKIESGEGKVILNGEEFTFSSGFSINIPAGTNHNILNTSEINPLKIYTIYSPPNHKDGTIHKTKQEALDNEEHYEA